MGYWTGLAKFQKKLTDNPEGRWTEIDFEFRPQLLRNSFACLAFSDSNDTVSDTVSQNSVDEDSVLPLGL